MTIAAALIVLVLATVVALTLRTVIRDESTHPPRSHARDRDLAPPGSLLS